MTHWTLLPDPAHRSCARSPSRFGGRLEHRCWDLLRSGKSLDEQLWTVRPPRRGLDDRQVGADWVARTLEHAGYNSSADDAAGVGDFLEAQARIAMPRLTRAPYSELAPFYDAALGRESFADARRAFELLASGHRIRFRSAADIGCGTGLFACYLSLVLGSARVRRRSIAIDARRGAPQLPGWARVFSGAGHPVLEAAGACRSRDGELRCRESSRRAIGSGADAAPRGGGDCVRAGRWCLMRSRTARRSAARACFRSRRGWRDAEIVQTIRWDPECRLLRGRSSTFSSSGRRRSSRRISSVATRLKNSDTRCAPRVS